MKLRRIISILLAVALLSTMAVVAAYAADTNISSTGEYVNKNKYEGSSYVYNGDDLGATYTPGATTWKVWSPAATKVQVKLYKTGSDREMGAAVIGTYDLTKGSNYVWSLTKQGDFKNVYYTYLVTAKNAYGSVVTNETQDIYSKAVGVNGNRSMVVDLDSTDPEGWENDKHVCHDTKTRANVWELHIQDFSADPDSGVSEKNRGTYLAFTEGGTTYKNEGNFATCMDYLVENNINTVQLMPFADFDGTDEVYGNSVEDRNWGYNPKNYNVPDGSYSSNAYDGNVRINEVKQMIQALHDRGISVVMDVVYNHTAGSEGSCFTKTVPGYYYRMQSALAGVNGSGQGNELASDKAMCRNFIVQSLRYWADEYHIDGFRFDLMGCIDTTTMNMVRLALDEIDHRILIYGEPWTADLGENGIPFEDACVKENAQKLSSRIAMFNDAFRNALKGNNDDSSIGYIQGNNHNIYYVISGILACSSTTFLKWAQRPTQCVTYDSAHDNLTLWDKLLKSCGRNDYDTTEERILAMNKLSAALIYTSQGIPFILAGEEMARTKRGDHNSYKSPLSINAIDWTRARTYRNLVNYYKGLIEIRKNFSPFREPSTIAVSNTYFETNGRAIAYTVPNITHAEWDMMAILFNNGDEPATITLKSHTTLPHSWVCVANYDRAGFEEIKRIDGNDIKIPPMTALILVDDKSYDRVLADKALKKENA